MRRKPVPLWARTLRRVERVVFRHSGVEPPFPGDTFLDQRRADAPPRQPTGHNLERSWQPVDKPIVAVEIATPARGSSLRIEFSMRSYGDDPVEWLARFWLDDTVVLMSEEHGSHSIHPNGIDEWNYRDDSLDGLWGSELKWQLEHCRAASLCALRSPPMWRLSLEGLPASLSTVEVEINPSTHTGRLVHDRCFDTTDCSR